MLTLFLLCEEDAYGYQLVQKIKERSKGFITVQEGSFYPLLYRLADDGYITGEEVKSHRKAAALFNKEQLLFCGERPLRNPPHNGGVGFENVGAHGGFCLHWKMKREYGKIAVQPK